MTLRAFSWELFLLGSHVSLISSRLRSQFVKLSHTTLNYVSSNDSLVLLQNVFLCCETSYSSHFLMWIQHHPLGAHQHIINSHQQSQLYANCSYAANGFVQDLDLQQMFPVVSGYRSEVPNGL